MIGGYDIQAIIDKVMELQERIKVLEKDLKNRQEQAYVDYEFSMRGHPSEGV